VTRGLDLVQRARVLLFSCSLLGSRVLPPVSPDDLARFPSEEAVSKAVKFLEARDDFIAERTSLRGDLFGKSPDWWERQNTDASYRYGVWLILRRAYLWRDIREMMKLKSYLGYPYYQQGRMPDPVDIMTLAP
jgi:hypothetical protein